MNAFKKIRQFFAMSWKNVPSYIILLFVQTLVSGGQVIVNVVLPKFLIDELTGGCDPQRLFGFGGLIVGSNLFFSWFHLWMKRCMDVQSRYVSQRMEQLLGEKIMSLPYTRLEDPYYLDLKERASFALVNQQALAGMINQLAKMLEKGVTLFGLTIIMLTLSPALVAVLLVLVGSMLLLQMRLSVYQRKIHELILPVNRRYGYYVNLVFQDEAQDRKSVV